MTAGIALVGASVIAVAPIAPHPEVHLPTVHLTAAVDNPIDVFTPVVNAAGNWITSTVQSEIANPFPILHQIITNQITTAQQLLEAVNAGAKGVGELAAGLPAALQAAGAKLAVGDVNGAIDAIISAGLNPIIGMITGVWTPLQSVLQRPFAVGQAMVPALFNAALSLTVGVVLSTVGIGFDTGTTPFFQQIVKSTQAVLTAVTTLDPGNIVNAIQHGLADVALNLFTQLDQFTTGTIPYIRDTIIAALQATPANTLSTVAASVTETTAAATVAATTAAAGTTDQAAKAAATESSAATESGATAAPATATESSTSPAATETSGTTAVPEPSTVSTAVESTPAQTKPTDSAPATTPTSEASTTKDAKDTTSLVRDSVKAEPGKVGAQTSGAGTGSAGQPEATGSTSGSEADGTASSPSKSTAADTGGSTGTGSGSASAAA